MKNISFIRLSSTMGKRTHDEDDGPPDDGFLDEQMITLFGPGPKLSTKIPHPIVLDHENFDYRLGLKKFQMYNSIPNVTVDMNNCLKIRPGANKEYILIKLDTGAYEMTQINDAIIVEILNKTAEITDKEKVHFKLGRSGATFKGQITLSEGWAVDFNVDYSIATLIGFKHNDTLDTNGIHKSENEVQIQGGFDSLLFLTNVTYPSILNGRMVPYIYHYSKNSPPGYNIVMREIDVTYKTLTANVISDITLWIEDEKGRAVNFNGENLTVELRLIRKPRRSAGAKKRNYIDDFG